MNIFVSGVSYKTTPISIREKLSFDNNEQNQMLGMLKEITGVEECVMLSTCNRMEIYLYSDKQEFNMEEVEQLLCSFKKIDIYEMKKHFYVYRGLKAVKHLFRVACGLDSIVLGEDQILGQIKSAHEVSLETKASAGVLNNLFRDAITAAKKVKTLTQLSKNSLSIGSLAVKLVDDLYGTALKGKCALVIGTGKIGSIAFKNLISKGIGNIYVTNRTHCRAVSLAKDHGHVHCIDYNDRYSVMDECDIIISSTSSPHYTITKDVLENSLLNNKERVFIDLAVPRDVDTTIKEITSVKYFNIDDLQVAVNQNIDLRMAEAVRAEDIIGEYVVEFEKWYEFRRVLPLVKDIQKFADGILNEKISSTVTKLKCASDEDKELVKASITGAVNSILNKFVYSIREYGNKEDVEAYFRCLKEVIKE